MFSVIQNLIYNLIEQPTRSSAIGMGPDSSTLGKIGNVGNYAVCRLYDVDDGRSPSWSAKFEESHSPTEDRIRLRPIWRHEKRVVQSSSACWNFACPVFWTFKLLFSRWLRFFRWEIFCHTFFINIMVVLCFKCALSSRSFNIARKINGISLFI